MEGNLTRSTANTAYLFSMGAVVLAEMGDKTQLAAIALTAPFSVSPFWVLMRTLTGMMIADVIGIFVGVMMCRNISGIKIKLVSAGTLILFGLIGSGQVFADQFHLGLDMLIPVMTALTAVTAVAAYYLIRKDKMNSDGSDSPVGEYCRLKEQEDESR